MYKILRITALASGMLLLAAATEAAPMHVEVANENSAGNYGLEVAANRASANARFNRGVAHASTMPLASAPARAVPAPATLALLGAGVLGAIVVRRRRPGH